MFGFSHEAVLQMPIKRFWFYNKQADRVRAEEDLRMINLLASVTSKDAYESALNGLYRQMGEIIVKAPGSEMLDVDGPDPEYERDKLLALKASLARTKKKVNTD